MGDPPEHCCVPQLESQQQQLVVSQGLSKLEGSKAPGNISQKCQDRVELPTPRKHMHSGAKRETELCCSPVEVVEREKGKLSNVREERAEEWVES